MKTPIFIITVLLALCNRVTGQQPSHFFLGSEIFSGTHIYDIYQAQDSRYWVATNNGMYSYDGYDFKKYECKEMTSVSLFQIMEDYERTVFFHNLSGQIFKIENDSCKLHYQVPEYLMANYLSFAFDNTNRLTIITKKLFQVDENENINVLSDKVNHVMSVGEIAREPDSTLVVWNPVAGRRIEIKNGQSKLINTVKVPELYPSYIHLEDRTVVFNKGTGAVYNDPVLTTVNPDNVNMLSCQSDGKHIWLSVRTGGVYIYEINGEGITSSNLLFESNIISAMFKDNEGNILLGTFGDGIIVIPNLDVVDLNVKNDKIKIVEVAGDSANIYLGAQNGRILKLSKEGRPETFTIKSSTNIEIFEILDDGKLLYNDQNHATILDLKSLEKEKFSTGSLKAVEKIGENQYLMTSNVGVHFYTANGESPIELPGYFESVNYSGSPILSGARFQERTYSGYYDKDSECLYAGTSLGLKIGCRDSVFFFELNDHTILCTDMIKVDDRVFISTLKEGILIFRGVELINQWTEEQGILSSEVRQLKVHKNELYLSTKKGLQVLNLEQETLKTVNTADGLHSNVIIDFELLGDMLWAITDKGLQRIDLKKLPSGGYQPEVCLHALKVNDELADTAKHDFSYFENKFEFNIKSPSLKYREDIYYNYQLVGIDEDWLANPYEDHIIDYKSLPDGKYIFKVKAVYSDQESKIITYSFVIHPKFWETWWFLSIVFAVLIAGVWGLFKYQARKQRIKQNLEKQLIESKLTAIQAQMNPHFIFNALNSIQDLVLRQKGEKAYNYISKFALLVRKILNHSAMDFIALEEEVELLSLYLELEKLRFKKDFTFSIERKADENLEIPPMLVQPFVENAIKHGLFHKKGAKRLTVVFKMTQELLICEITDNGVGRKRAGEIMKRKKHRSFSVRSIESRFEILKRLYGGELGISIIDLNEGGETGTKVILKVPVKREF